MFRLALIILSGSMLGSLLSLGRSTGVPRAIGFDGVRAWHGLSQATFPTGRTDV